MSIFPVPRRRPSCVGEVSFSGMLLGTRMHLDADDSRKDDGANIESEYA